MASTTAESAPTNDNAAMASAAPPVSGAPEMAPAMTAGGFDPLSVTGTTRIADKAYFLTTAKWPSNTVPVCWSRAADAASPDAALVRQAVTATWQAASALRFIGWGTCAPNAEGIRIVVAETGPHTKGLGVEINGNPAGMVLNHAFRTWSQPCAASEATRQSCVRSIAVHEFGHAIGFAHEQNRWDTPGECRGLAQGGNGNVMLTPWDLQSVMNYCNPTYNNNGQLSALDRQAVAYVYR